MIGCGKVTLVWAVGMGAKSFTFDGSTGELVGASDYPDNGSACDYGVSPLVSSTGSTEACEHTETCKLCQEAGPDTCN